MDVDDGRAHAREEPAAEDLHVAREDDEVEAADEALEHRLLRPRPRVRRVRHVHERHAEGLDVGRARPRGWRSTTPTSAASSPLRRRHSRSSRQCSSRLTRIATRFGTSAREYAHCIPSSSATASNPSSGSACSNSIRIRKRPPAGSVECCAEEVMFAPHPVQEPRDGGDDARPVRAGDEQAAVHGYSAHDQVDAHGEQRDADDLAHGDRVLRQPEQAELVEHHRRRELPGDRRRHHRPRAELAHRHEHGRHVGRAEHAAGQVVPGQPARLAHRPEPALGERGDHGEQRASRSRTR